MGAEQVDPGLDAMARDLIRNFVTGSFDAMIRNFDEKLHAQLPASNLAVLQAKVTASYGKFHSVQEVHQITEETYRTIDVIAEFDTATVSFKVVFDSTAQVTAIRLAPVVTVAQ